MPRICIAFLLGIFTPLGLCAQNQAPEQGRGSKVSSLDGGVHGSLQSIVVPPKPDAPFTIVLSTEWTRGSSDSGTVTVVNERRIARDSRGRIYQERFFLVPKNGQQQSTMSAIQISDPNAHTVYTCRMDDRKVCNLTRYLPTAETVYVAQGPETGPLPNNAGYATRVDLGHQYLLGLETAGTREIVTLDAGVVGNDQRVIIEREFWYSSQLGINLLSTVSDPRFGKQTFTVTNVSTVEPDPKLFELPAGFKVQDLRETVPPTAR